MNRRELMDETLRALKAAADANRLRILRILAGGPFNVAEITEVLGVGQSTVSRHLKILADAGLVEARRAGTWAFYSVASPDSAEFAGELLALLEKTPNGGEDLDTPAIERVLARRRLATSEFFRETASSWDEVRDRVLGPAWHRDRLVALVGRGGTVVDLGTGTGVLLEALAPGADRVIGVDASPEMLEVARQRTSQDLDNADLRLGTLEHLPLSDGEADTMIANMVLHHVADLPGVFREVRRGLRPEGRILIADLEEHDQESLWRALGARWPGFRPEDVREMLESAGFEIVGRERLPAVDSKRPPVFLVEARRIEIPSTRGGNG
jgi:ArsR family transcriptional regulator